MFESFFSKRPQQAETANEPPKCIDISLEASRRAIGELYAKHGQPLPDADTLERLNGKKLRDVSGLCGRIAAGGHLEPKELMEAHELGLRNLREIRFSSYITDKSLTNTDFTGADFRDAVFTLVDFSNSNLTDIRLSRHDGTNFHNSILNTATMPRVVIGGEVIDLTKGSVTLHKDDIWQIHKSEIEDVGACSDCEYYNSAILGVNEDSSRYTRRGVLLFQDGKPLGYMKLKGEKSFIALRTVHNREGEALFWRGMVYTLEPDVNDELKRASAAYQGEAWRKVNVEDLVRKMSEAGRKSPGLGRNNMRFITGIHIYDALETLVERLEAGTEPVEQVL